MYSSSDEEIEIVLLYLLLRKRRRQRQIQQQRRRDPSSSSRINQLKPSTQSSNIKPSNGSGYSSGSDTSNSSGLSKCSTYLEPSNGSGYSSGSDTSNSSGLSKCSTYLEPSNLSNKINASTNSVKIIPTNSVKIEPSNYCDNINEPLNYSVNLKPTHSVKLVNKEQSNHHSIEMRIPIKSLIKFEEEDEEAFTTYNTGELNSLPMDVTVIKEEFIEEDDVTNENYEFTNANMQETAFAVNEEVKKEIFVKEEYIIDDLAREAENNSYVCKFCFKNTTDWKTLLNHHLTHLTIKLERCDRLLQKTSPKRKNKSTNRTRLCDPDPATGLWQCIVCLKSYNTYKNWFQHVTCVHSAYNLECELCHKLYHNYDYLKDHMKYMHKGKKKTYLTKKESPCTECSAVLDTEQALKTHMRTVHSPKSFDCDICGLKYKCFPYLQTHKRRVHKEIGMFTCDVCSKSFKSRRRLTIHIKRPHVLFQRQKSNCKRTRKK